MYVHGVSGRSSSRPADPSPARPLSARDRLVESALASLIEIGFSRTTGVEVCRRAELTRGALNHHFPDYGQLLAAALGTAYDRILAVEPPASDAGPIERWALRGVAGVRQPEFKAIIELWLASKNDPELGQTLTDAIALGAPMFDPASALDPHDIDARGNAVFNTIKETCIGLGVGRATGGVALEHEESVVSVLLELARSADQNGAANTNAQNTKGNR